MAFIQPCFIKKITTELKKKLKELGYKDVGKARYYGESQYIYCKGCIFYESPCTIEDQCNTFIDCGDNEELFLAIAALRDDTDINQWIIYNTINNTVGKFKTIEWTLCKDNNICDYLNWDNCYKYCHKATMEEIIEHFKKQ